MRTKKAKIKKPVDIGKIFREGKQIDRAVKLAARNAVILHKKLGVPMVGLVNGRIVDIPPEKLKIPRVR